MDIYTSTPRPRDAQMFDSSSSDVSDVATPAVSPKSPAVSHKSSSTIKEKAKAKKNSKILDLIREAVKEIGVARKGASYNGIKKYVIEHGQKEKSGKLFLTHFKRAFVSGMEQKLLIRKDSSQDTGLRGYFVLPKEPKVKAKKDPPPPKQVAKPRAQKPVSNVVLLARKKKNMAIMNGSLTLKRNSLLLKKVKKSRDSGKAKKAKNPKSEDAPKTEPGPSKKPSTAKASKKEQKLPAEKQVKAAPRGKKQTKALASGGNEDQQLQKTKAVAKKQPKTVDPAKNQSKATTKKQAETKKPQAVPKAKTLDNAEAPKRKQKTVPSDETEIPKRKQMKTASSDEAEAPAKKHSKTKAPSKKNLKTKTPTESKVSSKEMNTASSDEAEAATDEQMKSALSDENEVPAKKQPKTKAPPKKNLKTKEISDTEVSTKEMNTSSGEAEVSTTKQMKTAPADESGSSAKRQLKKKAQKSPNGVPNRKQMKTAIPDEDGIQQNVVVPAKKQPKGVAQASGSKKLLKNETYIEKQPEVGTDGPTSKNLNMKEKKPKKKEIPKLIDKVRGRKNLRRDVSDSELDVSTRRTKPLKSYHSDPEVSMMEN